MDLNTVIMAATWTGIVWALGAFSTWLAVKPLRRRVDGLEAWRRRKEDADEGFRRDTLEYVAVCEKYFAADKDADEAGGKWLETSRRLQDIQGRQLEIHERAVQDAQGRIERLEAVSEALKDNLWAVEAKLKVVAKACEGRNL